MTARADIDDLVATLANLQPEETPVVETPSGYREPVSAQGAGDAR